MQTTPACHRQRPRFSELSQSEVQAVLGLPRPVNVSGLKIMVYACVKQVLSALKNSSCALSVCLVSSLSSLLY